MTVIAPGATIGILGGGQLGRMLAMAAAQLGYRVHVFAPEADAVAAEVAAGWTRADYADGAALARFAGQCAVVTYEFENIPVAPLRAALAGALVRPSLDSLAATQDRLAERALADRLGVRVAPWRALHRPGDLDAAIAALGCPLVLKTATMGYDGKGQARLADAQAPRDEALALVAAGPVLAEAHVGFDAEFSVILARGPDGAVRFWESARNDHRGGILRRSSVPAGPAVLAQVPAAREAARAVAEALDHVGVIACEFFATADGPVLNEIAPRVHNSGHWTIEGAVTSQFANHVRAICGLPLGDTGSRGQVVMDNLIGDEAGRWMDALAEPGAALHLYGKGEAREGRKMGHVTRLVAQDLRA